MTSFIEFVRRDFKRTERGLSEDAMHPHEAMLYHPQLKLPKMTLLTTDAATSRLLPQRHLQFDHDKKGPGRSGY